MSGGFESRSAAETEAFGRQIGELCEAGDLLALVGDLGAGKSCFTRGLARGLGIAGPVPSPTFVLMNRYEGRVGLAHVDLYRLDTVDLASLGCFELREDHVLVVEWADKTREGELGDALRIRFEVTGEFTRHLSCEALGVRSRTLLEKLGLSP